MGRRGCGRVGAHFLGDIFPTSCFSEKRKPNMSLCSSFKSLMALGLEYSL